jgi:hypothetical protein
MNRLLLPVLITFLSLNGKAQETRYPIKLHDVVWLKDSTTKASDEYSRAKLFFADEYRSAKDVISFDDPGTFTIVGRGWIDLKSKNINHKYAKLWHTIKIECKDGRYRYELSDMKIEIAFSGFYGGIQTSTTDYLKTIADIGVMKEGSKKEELTKLFVKPMEDIIARLNAAMNTSRKDDW